MLCVALWGDKAGAERIAELDWACEHRAFTGLSVVRGRERLLVLRACVIQSREEMLVNCEWPENKGSDTGQSNQMFREALDDSDCSLSGREQED